MPKSATVAAIRSSRMSWTWPQRQTKQLTADPARLILILTTETSLLLRHLTSLSLANKDLLIIDTLVTKAKRRKNREIRMFL